MIPKKTAISLLIFVVLGAALGFANGRIIVPGLIWLLPGLLLIVLRRTDLRTALAGLALVGLIIGVLQWNGVVPLPAALSLPIAAVLGLILMLPFLADRLLKDRLGPWMLIWVFPFAQVTLELGTSTVLPYATFGAWGYTQVGFPVVLQTASLVGVWGVSFVVALSASLVAALADPADKRKWAPPAIAASLIIASLVFGFARLATPHPLGKAIKVVGIASKPSDLSPVIETKYGCGPDNCANARAIAKSQTERMLLRTKKVIAQHNPDIVVWSEVAAALFPQDVAPFEAATSAIARDTSTFIAPATLLVRPGQVPWQNDVRLIGPDGVSLSTHVKAHPVPGELSTNGPDVVTKVATPIGPLAMAICYDMDFPALGRQAAGSGLVLTPGSDWAAIDPLHPNMVALRAVENGYAVVRPSRESKSVAFDAFGRNLGEAAWIGNDEPTLVVTVSMASIPTIYSRIGDVFAYFLALAFLILSTVAVIRSRQGNPH